MKTKSFYLAGSILLAVGLGAAAQQFYGSAEALIENPDEGEQLLDLPSFFLLDRNTWEVSAPEASEIDLSAYNTLEAKWERYLATLAFEFPDEYQRRFPPTEEELASAAEARQMFENPPALDEILRTARSWEERKKLEESLRAILEPMTVVER